VSPIIFNDLWDKLDAPVVSRVAKVGLYHSTVPIVPSTFAAWRN